MTVIKNYRHNNTNTGFLYDLFSFCKYKCEDCKYDRDRKATSASTAQNAFFEKAAARRLQACRISQNI